MAHIQELVTETKLLERIVETMELNGWEVFHKFTQVSIDRKIFETKLEYSSRDGIDEPIEDFYEWDIPEGMDIHNFKAYYRGTAPSNRLEEMVWDINEEGDFTIDYVNRKVIFPTRGEPGAIWIYYPDVSAQGEDPIIDSHIGKHYILRNNVNTPGKTPTYFGIAQTANIHAPMRILTGGRPFVRPEGGDLSNIKLNSFGEDVVDKLIELVESNPNLVKPSIYTYMIDELGAVDGVLSDVYVNTHMGTSRGKIDSLDVELMGTKWFVENTDGLEGYGKEPQSEVVYIKPTNMQSPLVEIDYRHPDTGGTHYDFSIGSFVTLGNYWSGSLMRLSGYVDAGTAVFILQCDTSPSFQINATPIVPIYMGEIELSSNYREEPSDTSMLDAIFGGSVPKGPMSAVPLYDFDIITESSNYVPIMPLLKEFDNSLGNGLTNIIIRRTKEGGRYIKHYVSTLVPTNEMVPDRVHDVNNLEYPRAWQQATNREYDYRFNPSSYTEDVTAGEAYVVHPELGMTGTLRHMLLTNPLSIVNGDTLRITDDFCDDSFTDYTYHLVEGVSPITKRPSIHYRPMGIAVKN